MKKIMILFLLSSFTSLVAQAKTISAVAPTIADAEGKISRIAEDEGKSYKIIGAHNNNYVYMIAKLVPAN